MARLRVGVRIRRVHVSRRSSTASRWRLGRRQTRGRNDARGRGSCARSCHERRPSMDEGGSGLRVRQARRSRQLTRDPRDGHPGRSRRQARRASALPSHARNFFGRRDGKSPGRGKIPRRKIPSNQDGDPFLTVSPKSGAKRSADQAAARQGKSQPATPRAPTRSEGGVPAAERVDAVLADLPAADAALVRGFIDDLDSDGRRRRLAQRDAALIEIVSLVRSRSSVKKRSRTRPTWFST